MGPFVGPKRIEILPEDGLLDTIKGNRSSQSQIRPTRNTDNQIYIIAKRLGIFSGTVFTNRRHLV